MAEKIDLVEKARRYAKYIEDWGTNDSQSIIGETTVVETLRELADALEKERAAHAPLPTP